MDWSFNVWVWVWNVVGFVALAGLHYFLGLRFCAGLRFVLEMVLAVLLVMLQFALYAHRHRRYAAALLCFVNRCIVAWPLLIPYIIFSPLNRLFIIAAYYFSHGLRPSRRMCLVVISTSFAVHLLGVPWVEQRLLPASPADLMYGDDLATHCPKRLLDPASNLLDGRDESLALGLFVGYRALQGIPNPALEADFCNAERALEIISPAIIRSTAVPTEVERVRRWITCHRTPANHTTSSSAPPPPPLNAKLIQDYVVPLQAHRDALGAAIYAYGNVTRPIYDSWLFYQVTTHKALSSPFYSSLHNAFATPCDAPILSSATRLRCQLLSRTTVRWVQRLHHGAIGSGPHPLWSLRSHVLPNFAREVHAWHTDLLTNLPRIRPALVILPAFPTEDRSRLRDLGVNDAQALNYNSMLEDFLTQRPRPKHVDGKDVGVALECLEWVLANPWLPESPWSPRLWEVLNDARFQAEGAVRHQNRATLAAGDPTVVVLPNGKEGFAAWVEWVDWQGWWEWVVALVMAVLSGDWDGWD
ncbi:unnamed protein product [Zymoseptoria tritici ST99CH_3D7]|uniref:Uncharacterized protein n=1 Tax=Zymoseptoria tritici (strain ST99CH_3D7) TaxID=1276538 RepID=A0A1X7SA60_ZYMT9|nr:unnamed protein product [Zymoseptoria tritici ST99CH_3D7]